MTDFFNHDRNPDHGTADMILIEAEKRVQAQTAFLLASDTRALGLLSSSIALAAAALAFLGVAMALEQASPPMIFCSLTMIYNSIRAVHFSVEALKPVAFQPSGWPPLDFKVDIDKGKSQLEIKIEMIGYIERRLSNNRTIKESLDESTRKAMDQLASAPSVAVLAFVMGIIFTLYR